jgi:L-lysine 6-transaminase
MEIETKNAVSPEQVEPIFMKYTNAEGMMPMVLDLSSSDGLDLHDQRTGKKYLDFFGFYASSALGMNHPKMRNDEDFLARLQDASINKVTNSDVRTVHMARFLKTFGRIAMRDYLPYAFFISGGSLAVENALKAAFDWKVRKNIQKGLSDADDLDVLHFTESFHGRSGYTLSLTNTSDPRKTMYFPKFDWPRISNPKIQFPIEDNLEDLIRRENESLAEARQAFADRPDKIACIIIEPIQGEGGDNHFRREFLQALKDLAHENDALLIFDEVQTGVGMAGTFWAHEAIGVTPDILSFGKKTQVCGILAGPKLDEVPDNVFHTGSRINSTWGGNLVDMVRFDKILEIIEEENLIETARDTGEYLLEQLHDLASQFDSISNVRGAGMLCAVDVSSRALRDKIIDQCYEDGLIMLGCGVQSLRFRPPLTMSRSEVDAGLSMLATAIRKVV